MDVSTKKGVDMRIFKYIKGYLSLVCRKMICIMIVATVGQPCNSTVWTLVMQHHKLVFCSSFNISVLWRLWWNGVFTNQEWAGVSQKRLHWSDTVSVQSSSPSCTMCLHWRSLGLWWGLADTHTKHTHTEGGSDLVFLNGTNCWGLLEMDRITWCHPIKDLAF